MAVTDDVCRDQGSGDAKYGEHRMESSDRNGAPNRWWWLLGIALLLAVAVGAWVVGAQIQNPNQAASRAEAPVPSWITAPVERRVLAQTLFARGDVEPEVSVAVGVPSSIEGAPVVTAIAVTAGQDVEEGERLFEVSGRPVFVLEGDVPVYRSLKPRMTGADVLQLQDALGRLGCDTQSDGAEYGESTKGCVAKMYADAGYSSIPTSATDEADLAAARQAVSNAQASVNAAQVAFDIASRGPTAEQILAADLAVKGARRSYNEAIVSKSAAVVDAQNAVMRAQIALAQLAASPDPSPSALAEAQNDVDTANASLGESQREGDSTIATAGDNVTLAVAARNALDNPPQIVAEYVALGQAIGIRDQAQSTLDQLALLTGPTVAQGEIVFVPNLPARVIQTVSVLGPLGLGSAAGAESVGGVSSATQLATLAAGKLVVEMNLPATERPLARPKMTVEILDERTGLTYPAIIAMIADAQSVGADGQSGFAAVLDPSSPLPDELYGTNVRVTVTAASTDVASLVVPLAAVSSGANGVTSVAVLAQSAPPGTEPHVVTIIAGISADGFVAVRPLVAGALKQDDRVVVGR